MVDVRPKRSRRAPSRLALEVEDDVALQQVFNYPEVNSPHMHSLCLCKALSWRRLLRLLVPST